MMRVFSTGCCTEDCTEDCTGCYSVDCSLPCNIPSFLFFISVASLWPWATRLGCFSCVIFFSSVIFYLTQNLQGNSFWFGYAWFKAQRKSFEIKIDPIFEHRVFDLARAKMRHFIRQHEKSQETFENLLSIYFKCGGIMFFLSQNRSGLLTKEHLYSTSAKTATINGEMDDTHYAVNVLSKFEQWVYPHGYTNHLNHIRFFRPWFQGVGQTTWSHQPSQLHQMF